MTDTLPDRLANNPNSSFYDEALLERGVGIRFNGVEKNNVEEYCVSEGWIRVAAGTARDRLGNPLTICHICCILFTITGLSGRQA